MVGAVVVAALVLRVPVPGLAERLSRRAESSWGLAIRSDGATFGLLGGTRLADLDVDLRSDGFRLHAEVSRVLVHHGWPLLRPIRIDRLQLLDPVVEVVIGPDETAEPRGGAQPARDPGPALPSPSPSPSPGVAPGWFDVDDLALELTRATLTLVDAGAGDVAVRASGLTARLERFARRDDAASWLRAVSAGGGFLADELRVGGARLQDARGRLDVSGGRIRLSDLRFFCGGAEMRIGSLAVDLQSAPLALMTREVEARSAPDAEWAPITNLRLLGSRCL